MPADPNDALLRYYTAELDYLMREGDAFAQRYPRAARNLRATADANADPHVARLIESFAFLTGRLQQDLDAGWPEVPEGLLALLYPHLVAPVPSQAIAQFTADKNHPRPAGGDVVPRHTTLFALAEGTVPGEDPVTVRFQTVYPVDIWPLAVTQAAIEDPVLHGIAPAAAESVLRLRIECTDKDGFAKFGARPDRLRFHLHADDRLMLSARHVVLRLYDLLFNSAKRVLIRGPGDSAFADAAGGGLAIREVGFRHDEAALPHPPEAHQGYRLLQEYFTFPQKFLFFDIEGLPAFDTGRSFELLFLLDQREMIAVTPDMFRLGCTPVVNLFRRTSEPVRIEPAEYEYRVVPDSRWERATEIHTILKVSSTSAPELDRGVIEPFFSYTHAAARYGQSARWLARRRPMSRPDLGGTEMVLSFHDENEFTGVVPPTPVLFAHTLCTNRSVAQQIDPGGMLEIEMDIPVAPGGICLLGRPTGQIDPPLGGETLWRLVSHLSLNHRSLVDGEDGIDALREILRLYARSGDPAVDDQINALTAVATRRIVGRVGHDAWRGFCRGTEITLEIDEGDFAAANGSVFLVGSVLSHFFALYAAINSFTQLVIRSSRRDGRTQAFEQRSNDTLLRRLPAMESKSIAL
jgi:type VI secretion system protein ImpG